MISGGGSARCSRDAPSHRQYPVWDGKVRLMVAHTTAIRPPYARLLSSTRALLVVLIVSGLLASPQFGKHT
jgi:hypothetical protein